MIDRKKIHKKYNGRCAYCGEEITLQSMQIDHIVSKTMHYKYPGIEPNRIDNLNPSCRKCNNFKTVWGIEEFRHELEMQVDRLRRVSQFDRALRYGLVEITNKPVTFYFEQVS